VIKVILSCLAVAVTATLVGCGEKSTVSATGELPPLEELITGIPDASSSPKSFGELFAQGVTVPEQDRKKYTQGYFVIESSEPGPDGTTVVKLSARDVMGNEKGKVEWTVVDESGKLKLKSAPLP